ncbi:MAG: class I SAM-dependent methyltransferase [Myxococcota bacterium]|nr:class I SAM-dependent methyltransferase [Myxococcota bacterium]
MNPPGSVQALFDLWATNGRAESMEAGHRPRALTALAALSLRETDKVLDLGCGNGWITRWLGGRLTAGSAVGVDLSPEMVARARSLSEEGCRASFHEGSLEVLPFDDGYFDHVVSMEVFYYADDLLAALRESLRVLRPGGSVTICVDFYEENAESHSWPERTGLKMNLLSEASWMEALRTSGFQFAHGFRCLDPGHGPQTEAGSSAFTEDVGTLVVRGSRPLEP